MAGNNSIQILRGNNVKSTAADKILLDGQPLYDRTTGYLYVGEGNTVANTQAVNAHYANSAGIAHELSNGLYFNGSGSSVRWDGSDDKVVYAPTSFGTSGQVWGMTSSSRVGWMDQTEIPGTVANANYANVAGKVDSNLNIRVAGTNYTFNGDTALNIRSKNLVASSYLTHVGAIPYANTSGNGSSRTPADVAWLAKGTSGQVLSATASGIAWANQNALNVNFANTAGGTNGTLSLTVMGDSFEYNGASNISVNNPFYNKRYDIVAYTTGASINGAVPYYSASYSGIEFASPTSDDDKGYVLTYGGGSHVSWSPPVQLYAIEDLGSRMYIVFSSPFGSTDSISFFNSLTTKGYNSASNPFRVVYGVRDNRPIRAIYANDTTSMASTRFTIMYLDGGTQFVSYNGTVANPARLAIHPLSHYKDLGTVR